MNSAAAQAPTEEVDAIYVPEIDDRYYRYGHFKKIQSIIESKKFFPVWITGLAGNGGTSLRVCGY